MPVSAWESKKLSPLDRPTARESLLSYGPRNEATASGEISEIADLLDDDPLAAARGAVNGVLWGAILWTVILWVLL